MSTYWHKDSPQSFITVETLDEGEVWRVIIKQRGTIISNLTRKKKGKA